MKKPSSPPLRASTALGPSAQEGVLEFVDDARELPRVSETLRGAELLFVDTEFDSSREGTRLSLVQVSRGETVYLIDALRLTDLSPLLSSFDAPGTTWVLHAGQQDVALLTNRLGLSRPPRLFDTQIAWALVTVEHSASLAYLKYRLLGVRGEKTHQADDWRRRPLPPPQLAYAAEDVLYLPAIHRALLQRCEALGRSEVVTEATLETLLGAPEVPGPLSIESFRNAWQLEREGQSVLRFLIGWYNGLSLEDRVSAPETKGLLAIASRRPRSMEDLASLRAVPRRTVNLHGRTLLEGIQRAVAGAGANEFTAIGPAPYGSAAEILAHGWLEAVRAEVCAALGIAPEIAFPARLTRRMRDTAVAAGKVEAASAHLTGWRRLLLEHEFLARAARFGKLP